MWIVSSRLLAAFEAVFWLYNSFLIYLELADNPHFEKYRIQQHKPKLRFQPAIIRRIVIDTLKQKIALVLFAPLLHYVLNAFGHVDIDAPRPSCFTVLWQVSLFIVIADAWGYWSHYLFHTRWLYIRFHKQHHAFKQPTGLVAALADPVEGLFSNLLALWLGAILLPIKHLFTLTVWICFRSYHTVNQHAGYDIPYLNLNHWAPSIFLGTRQHDFHHEQGKWNFGSIFYFWDNIMGTSHALSVRKVQAKSVVEE